tara:strand:+ start:1083 stop:2240 length:1158 start_codon:yes stop_codon:yes gene_type:complete
MATLIKHRNQYCSKIQKWNGVKQISTKIPLRTNQKSVAVVRHHKVEQSEKNIKEGIIQKYQFNKYFKWLNDEGTSEISLLTLDDASGQFINDYSVNVALNSIKRMKVTLNHIKDIWGSGTAIKQINISDIESFKRAYKDKHSVFGINLNLRNIKTFLRWCVDRNMIKNMPKIKMIREPKKLPKYINECDMESILNADNLSDYMKRVIYVYLTTGCRRSEIVQGILDGNILIVPADLSKSRYERQISLNDTQSKIVKEIHKKRDTHLLNGFKLDNFSQLITLAFGRACKRVGLKDYTLHCLRHTFAVTQWIITNDIYEVKNLLGHTSVKTTERYAQFNLDRLAQDFPNAYEVRLEIEKVRKNAINTPLINTPFIDSEDSSRIKPQA